MGQFAEAYAVFRAEAQRTLDNLRAIRAVDDTDSADTGSRHIERVKVTRFSAKRKLRTTGWTRGAFVFKDGYGRKVYLLVDESELRFGIVTREGWWRKALHIRTPSELAYAITAEENTDSEKASVLWGATRALTDVRHHTSSGASSR